MKRKMICLLLAVCFVLIPISTNVSASTNYDKTLYVNCYDGELNLRSAPSGSIIGAYSNGTPVLVDISEKNGNYVPVKIGNKTGWMYYEYLDSSCPYNYSTTLYTNCYDGELNLRRKPIDGIVIGVYTNGTAVKADISVKTNNYVPVKVGNLNGWMYYPYLKSNNTTTTAAPTEKPTAAPTEKPTVQPTPTPTNSNVHVMTEVPKYDLSSTDYIQYKGEKYYIQVPGHIRNNADYLDGSEWEIVKEFSKVVDNSVDWETLIKEYDVYGTENKLSGFTLDLAKRIMENIKSIRVNASLQTNGTKNRAIIRTNIEVINHDTFINNTFSMTYLYRKINYPNFYYIWFYEKKETIQYIDNLIRSEVDFPFKDDEQYDFFISLSKEHKEDVYSSYIAYNAQGELMLYPIVYLNDKMYIFRNGKRNDIVITINDIYMGKVPFPEELLAEIEGTIPK